MSSQWTIVYYSHDEHIHADVIRAANPEAQVLLLDTRNDLPYGVAWSSGDRLLRNALKSEFCSIRHNNILMAEWDVLVTQKLPDIQLSGIQFSVINTPEISPDWMWWKDFDRLPAPLRQQKIGGVPIGLFAIDKSSMWKILDPRFDEIFELDIFSEVRLSAVCSFCGISQTVFDPNIFPKERILASTTAEEVAKYEARFAKDFENKPGIYHPVKRPIRWRG